MNEREEVGTEARSNREIPEKKSVDIRKIMQQSGISTDRWNDYIQVQQKY